MAAVAKEMDSLRESGTAYDAQGRPTAEYQALEQKMSEHRAAWAEAVKMSPQEYAGLRQQMTEMQQSGTAYDAGGKPTAEYQSLVDQQR